MRKFLMIVSLFSLAVFFGHGNSYAFPKGEEKDCIKCHTLNADQAKEVMTPFAPDIKILNVKQSPLIGIWEIWIETGGKKNIAYLDYSKKMLVIGNMLDTKTRVNYSKESFDTLNKVDVSQIPLGNALVMGDKEAKHKIIVFDDPE